MATDWATRLYRFRHNGLSGRYLRTGAIRNRYVDPASGVGRYWCGIGSFVPLLKGWYMFFWPIRSFAILLVSAVAGSLMTNSSERYRF